MPEKSKIIVKIDPEIQELIPKFLERMDEKTKLLKAASEHADFETIAGLAHRIKGSARGYGFDLLTQYAAKLEESAEKKQSIEAKNLIREIADFLNRVEIIYEK